MWQSWQCDPNFTNEIISPLPHPIEVLPAIQFQWGLVVSEEMSFETVDDTDNADASYGVCSVGDFTQVSLKDDKKFYSNFR